MHKHQIDVYTILAKNFYTTVKPILCDIRLFGEETIVACSAMIHAIHRWDLCTFLYYGIQFQPQKLNLGFSNVGS